MLSENEARLLIFVLLVIFAWFISGIVVDSFRGFKKQPVKEEEIKPEEPEEEKTPVVEETHHRCIDGHWIKVEDKKLRTVPTQQDLPPNGKEGEDYYFVESLNLCYFWFNISGKYQTLDEYYATLEEKAYEEKLRRRMLAQRLISVKNKAKRRSNFRKPVNASRTHHHYSQ